MAPTRKCDTILSIPLKPSVVFRVRTKRRKKNKHTMANLNHTGNRKHEPKDHRAVFLWATFNFIKIESGKEHASLCYVT